MSPIDSYYVVLDALTDALGVPHILNTDPLAKHLNVLMTLANIAEHRGEEE